MNYLIESENIVLRNFTLDDVEEFYKITNDVLIKKFVPNVHEETIEETREAIELYTQADFKNDFYIVIEDKKSNKIIGALIITRSIKDQYEVDGFISYPFRKKGYMKEALKALFSSLPDGMILNFYVETINKSCIRHITKITGMKEVTVSNGLLGKYRRFVYVVK